MHVTHALNMAAAQPHTSPPGGSHRLSATCTGGSRSIPLCSVHTCAPGASSIRGDQYVIWHWKRSQCTIVLHGESSKRLAPPPRNTKAVAPLCNATVHIYIYRTHLPPMRQFMVGSLLLLLLRVPCLCRSCSLCNTANYAMLELCNAALLAQRPHIPPGAVWVGFSYL